MGIPGASFRLAPTVKAASSMTRYSLRSCQAMIASCLTHQARPGVQRAVPKNLIEGKVVESLDQVRVGHRQDRDVAWENWS